MRYFLLVVAALFFSATVSAQNVQQDAFVPIAKYIEKGDAENLSLWFADNLEIDILGNVNVSSKAQAKQIMKEFFSRNTPKSFSISYRSGKAPMKYAIGTLAAGGEKFRITLFVKTQESGNFLQQIRVEKE